MYHLNIALFLQPIDVKERCGIIQSYRVTMQEVLPFGKIENTTTETFPPDRVSYKIQLELQKKYKIKLTQRTNVGYPIKDDSHILEIQLSKGEDSIYWFNSTTLYACPKPSDALS
jgi:hypothetical protein